MKRFLLFDSNCSLCQNIAQTVEMLSASQLQAISLSDPAMQELLTKFLPNWKWEPTLIELRTQNDASVYTGAKFKFRLAALVGPRNAIQLWRLTRTTKSSKLADNVNRRQLLKGAGILAAAVAASSLQPNIASASVRVGQTNSTPTNSLEEFEGFVLLPSNETLPDFIKQPQRGIPIVCGVGASKDFTPTAQSRQYSDLVNLERSVGFPIYQLSPKVDWIRSTAADVILHDTGEVYLALLNYQFYDEASAEWATGVRILAQPDFMRPYPVWLPNANDDNAPHFTVQKSTALPSPGIEVATPYGYTFHWIKDNVFYTLIVERDPAKYDKAMLLSALEN